MNSIELNEVTRDLTTKAEMILAMANHFSDLADREALKELRACEKMNGRQHHICQRTRTMR